MRRLALTRTCLRAAAGSSLALVALGSLAFVTGAAARTAVVGGAAIEIQQAPWHVALLQNRGSRFTLCGGAIIDAQRVVTAGHCVFDQAGQPASAASLTVRAGVSNFVTPRASDSQQTRTVVSFRIHPGYVFSSTGSPDDIAVLTLDAPLDFGGPAVKPIALPSSDLSLAAGDSVSVAGFGRQASNADPDGTLNRLDGMLADPATCGSNNAVVLCASSTVSSVCSGDSGSALTIGSGSTLIGVASTGSLSCRPGGIATYTSLAAPEILRFVQGEESPPTAPRRMQRPVLTSPEAMQIGQTLACSGGEWSGSPTLSYAFVDSQTEVMLQTGPAATYVFRASDLGRTFACRVSATNTGGTGVSESEPTLQPVRSSAQVRAPAVAARRGQLATLRVTLAGAFGVRGNAEICVKPARRIGDKVCRTTRLVGSTNATTRIRLPVSATAPPIVARVAVTARLADGRTLGTTGFIRIRS
jgi:hypothetical protein